jgi:biotin synthase
MTRDILDVSREQVFDRGVGLDQEQIVAVLRLPDERVGDALELAHQVRMRWCGPEVEVEGIVSVKNLVAAVRGPDARLMAQVREGVAAINEAVEINVACSLGILSREQAEELRDLGVHRYNHNLETARSHFPEVVTTHTWEERFETLELVREMGMERPVSAPAAAASSWSRFCRPAGGRTV